MENKKNLAVIADGNLTLTEAVGFSRVSRSALYGLMERGELAYVKIGKRRLIPRRALLDLLAEGVVCSQK